MALPGLNFRPGKVVESAILQTFGTSVCVHPSFPSKCFFLVASFGRCKYKLTVEHVAIILQATIGGFASLFNVHFLSDRVFRFSVFSHNVGFHIYKLRSFECSNYKIFFNLWHEGGPDYISEFRRWCSEEQASWTKVVTKPSTCSSSNPVRPPLTGANSVPVHHGQAQHYGTPSKLLCHVINVQLRVVLPLPIRSLCMCLFCSFIPTFFFAVHLHMCIYLCARGGEKFHFQLDVYQTGDGRRRGLRTDHAPAKARAQQGAWSVSKLRGGEGEDLLILAIFALFGES